MLSSNHLIKQSLNFFNVRKLIILCSLFPLISNATVANAIIADQNFLQCKINLVERANTAGFSPYITQTVIADISPIKRVIALDKKQPEDGDYFFMEKFFY